MTDLQKYNTHKAIYEDAKEYADSLIASANAELTKSQRTTRYANPRWELQQSHRVKD